jgi:hypothetical protein
LLISHSGTTVDDFFKRKHSRRTLIFNINHREIKVRKHTNETCLLACEHKNDKKKIAEFSVFIEEVNSSSIGF